ncbi:uncharacterized protein UTRI_03170_B [Ustilago trichophora]|uniref:Aprataxin C2HE/C2H2/C2HC zinc finger domain-containing protein n=1 Tax=Ustilago trichophora TaxID=86804 RepID=A0A5C3E3Y8_9BASI|nr:uncharacterized protein UTRI_03170_B [Ustilago trichophora]
MAPKWNQALVRIASAKDPATLPTDDKVLFYDDHTITIYDKFAKAKYHFLVLPRIPFKATSSQASVRSAESAPTLVTTNGKLNFGATSSNTVPASHMNSISTLLASPYAAQVLQALRRSSDRVLEHIRNDMKELYGVVWDIERAFHSVPSMEHLHLHVTSMDLVSDRLKHKKHFLSFHPTVGFAVRLDEAEDMARQGKRSLPKGEQMYEQLLKGPLMSHHTGQVFRFFPELKAHLESYWRDSILSSSSAAGECGATSASSKRGSSDVDGSLISSDAGSKGQRPSQSRRIEPSDVPTIRNSAETDSGEEEPTLPMKR